MKKDSTKLENVLAALGVVQPRVDLGEALISTLGGLLALLSVVFVSRHFVGDAGPGMLVASMGASAVLLFALPHGHLSQPWAVVGGHVVSAIVGVAVARMISDPVVAGAVAVGVAIGLMQVLRCVHPPGGATALSAVVGGPAVHALGMRFALTPVLLNALLIVGVAVTWNGLFAKRRYPAFFALKEDIPLDESIDELREQL